MNKMISLTLAVVEVEEPEPRPVSGEITLQLERITLQLFLINIFAEKM